MKSWTTYLGALIAVFAIISGAMGWANPEIVWGVAGIFGFGSVAVLRSWIESNGWKTYTVAGIPIIFGILLLVGFIDLDTYKMLISAFAPLTSITVQQALVKEKK